MPVSSLQWRPMHAAQGDWKIDIGRGLLYAEEVGFCGKNSEPSFRQSCGGWACTITVSWDLGANREDFLVLWSLLALEIVFAINWSSYVPLRCPPFSADLHVHVHKGWSSIAFWIVAWDMPRHAVLFCLFRFNCGALSAELGSDKRLCTLFIIHSFDVGLHCLASLALRLYAPNRWAVPFR